MLKIISVKTHSSTCKLLLDFPADPVNHVNSSFFLIFQETFSPFRELQGLEMYYTMKHNHIR